MEGGDILLMVNARLRTRNHSRKLWRTLLAAGALGALVGCGNGLIAYCEYPSGFSTVDDVTSGSGFLEASPVALTSYGRSTLYAAGVGYPVLGDYNQSVAMVRKSVDGGVTWSQAGAVYSYPGATLTDAYGIATDSSGNPVTVGVANLAPTHWITRRSTDGGVTWSSPSGSNDYTYVGATAARGVGIKRVPGTNSLLAMGYGGAGDHSLARTSTDGGATWSSTLAMDYTNPGGGSISLYQIFLDATGAAFVFGPVNDGTRIAAGLMRSSTPLASWGSSLTAKVFLTGATTAQQSYFSGMTAGLGTDLYVSAKLHDGTRSHWRVLKSIDGGVNWTSLEDYVYASGQPGAAKGIVADVKGNLYVAGVAFDGTKSHYMIRKGANWGTNWTTIDDFTLSGNAFDETAWDAGFGANGSGDLVYSFTVSDATVYHWVTRRAGCQ